MTRRSDSRKKKAETKAHRKARRAVIDHVTKSIAECEQQRAAMVKRALDRFPDLFIPKEQTTLTVVVRKVGGGK